MNHDTGIELKNPGVSGEVWDVLTEVLRQGAQRGLRKIGQCDKWEPGFTKATRWW
jgi:hypothetical protein